MQQLSALWSSLDSKRQYMAIGGGVAAIVAFVFVLRVAMAPGMALLYSGLDQAAAGEVVQALETRNVAHDVRGDAIYVAADRRDELRLTLAAQGLPANTHAGYELLDSLTGFGTTSQMFDAAYWRAKEGELARTIVATPYLRRARVHIAQAEDAPFQRAVSPTASVTVTTVSGALAAEQARALRHLVAAAVSGMTPDDVAIIDSVNGLVQGGDEAAGPAGQTDTRAQALRARLELLLEAHVGPGRAVVEVSLAPVTDREVITERRVDPDSRVVISSDTEESDSTSSGPAGQGVTVASNLPDGEAEAPEAKSERRESQSRQRMNYEVSETLREVERGPGAIRRMTVAVLVGGIEEPQPDGSTEWRARTDAELDALRELVASAAGYDADRGDVITLQSLRLQAPPARGTEAGRGLFDPARLDVMTLLKWAFVLVALLVLALFVLRPILRAANQRALDGPAPNAPVALAGTPPEGSAGALARYDGAADPPPEDDPVQRLRRLMEERQDESAQLLRHWMDQKREPS